MDRHKDHNGEIPADIQTNIGSTNNYQWNYSKKLGQGASCNVYEGTIKKTGASVAVKIFTSNGMMILQSTQGREFDVLHRISHKNIVKFIAAENDINTLKPVIIMELCDFSLRDMLDMPENILGLSEKNILTAIRDITNGVKYLRDNNVAHRDIKPGNIMCLKKDYSLIFKLTDFGASKILKENQQFHSLSGTEEYIHPDIYKRAFYRDQPQNILTANTDLWSIGATFYHIITGQLPFRPYLGRRNKDVFCHMITEKKSGVISAYQEECLSGPIIYCTQLPEHCRVSKGLGKHITPMLAGLMEYDSCKAWDYKKFFDFIKELMDMIAIHVFMPSTSTIFKVYVPKNDPPNTFSHEVKTLTGILEGDQKYFFEYDELFPILDKSFGKNIKTSIDKPIILINNRDTYSSNMIFETYPKLMSAPSNKSFKDDYKFIEQNVAILYYIQGLLEKIIEKQKLYTEFSTTSFKVLKKLMNRLVMKINNVRECIIYIPYLFNSLINDDMDVTPNRHSDNKILSSVLQNILSNIHLLAIQKKEFETQRSAYDEIYDYVFKNKEPNNIEISRLDKWKEIVSNSQCSSSCIEKFNSFLQQIVNIYAEYKKDKITGNVYPINEGRHNTNKQKCIEITTMAISLLSEHCSKNLKQMNTNHVNWWNENIGCHLISIVKYDIEIEDIKKNLTDMKNKIYKIITNLNSYKLEYFKLIYTLESSIPKQIKPEVQYVDSTSGVNRFAPVDSTSGVNRFASVSIGISAKPVVQSVSTNTDPEQKDSSHNATGYSGIAGATGYSGIPGATGYSGIPGATGASIETNHGVVQSLIETNHESTDGVDDLYSILEQLRNLFKSFQNGDETSMKINTKQMECIDTTVDIGMGIVENIKQKI